MSLKYSFFFLLLLSTKLIARPNPADCITPLTTDEQNASELANFLEKTDDCPADGKATPGQLCSFVEFKISERGSKPDKNGKKTYQYKSLIMKAACVNEKDDEETVKTKIQKFWSDNYDEMLLCNSGDINLSNASVVKLAVATTFDQFINDVISWKVNLNKVDADGRTVLDYVSYLLEKESKDSTMASILQRYYTKLASAGAKHLKDIKK